jgi:tetratricopeptide (TPR) repeat protein
MSQTDQQMDRRKNRGRDCAAGEAYKPDDWLLAAVLVVVVFLVYQPAWHGGFVWDDDQHVTRPELRSIRGLGRIWFDVGATLQYYPLLHSGFWLEHRLWGNAALGYHLANIALHALAAVLVLAVLRRLELPGAYLAAAIFALHPVQVESVAWISEQKNTLSAVFYLGAALFYLRFQRTRKRKCYAGAAGLFVLALLSKTVTATLPGALLVIFWWQHGRLSWKKDVLPLVPFFLLGAVGGMITAWWELKINQCVGPDFTFSFVERLLLAGRTAWFCCGKLFWPVNLTFIYPRWQIDARVWWQYLFPLAAAAGLALSWAMRRRSRAPLAALLFFGGTLFPVLGFFNLYTFRYALVADHYQYLACLGIITVFAAGVASLVRRTEGWKRTALEAASAALLVVMAVASWRQSRTYTDVRTLYQATIARNPECWMAYSNLGTIYSRSGRIAEGIECFRQALRIKPDYIELHNNLGKALAISGRVTEGIEQFQQALRIKPDYAKAHANLGAALLESGRLAEAVEHLQQALRSNPSIVEARANLAWGLARLGRYREAIGQADQALRQAPDDPGANQVTAWLLATHEASDGGDPARAVMLAEKACALAGRWNARRMDTLAAAYAAAGQFDRAVEIADDAARLARLSGQAESAVEIQARLSLYRVRNAYRESSTTAERTGP